MFKKTAWGSLALLLTVPLATAGANVITDWDEKGIAVVQTKMPPPSSYRVMAMVHLAMFEAINAIEPRYKPYKTNLSASPDTSKEAAATAAAAMVLRKLVPDAANDVQTAATAELAAVPDGDAKTNGVKLGEQAATVLLEARDKDGFSAADAYRPRTTAGVYIPTPLTVGAQFPGMTPFAMTSASQFEERAMGERLQRDQGARRKEQHEAHAAAERGCEILGADRPGIDASDPAPDRDREEHGCRQHGTVDGAGERRRGGCAHRGPRRQVQIPVLAADHGDPQWRHRRQPRDRA